MYYASYLTQASPSPVSSATFVVTTSAWLKNRKIKQQSISKKPLFLPQTCASDPMGEATCWLPSLNADLGKNSVGFMQWNDSPTGFTELILLLVSFT